MSKTIALSGSEPRPPVFAGAALPGKLFGTDGIRGRAGEFPMTVEVARALGAAVSQQFAAGKSGANTQAILIGRDTRRSSPLLEQAVAQGVELAGGEVWLIGVVPTPALSYLIHRHAAAAGVMVSASHNPAHDNGLKVFCPDGRKCSDAQEAALEAAIWKAHATSGAAGQYAPRDSAGLERPDLRAQYERYIGDAFSKLDLKKFRIAVDAANGASHHTTPAVLRALGADVRCAFDRPDGMNINADCGSTCAETIEAWVRETKADVGISHDGDADRVLLCDENGHALDGDELLAILALDALEQGTLAKKTLVATVMSNLGLDECLQAKGARVERVNVGDRFVAQEMDAGGYTLGGEQSGHIIIRPIQQTGDGLVAALAALAAMKRRGRPLSQLRKQIHLYPQRLTNLLVKEKRPLEDWPEVQAAVRDAEKTLNGFGRILLRYSGTEPKVRLLVEAKEEKWLAPITEAVLKPIQDAIGR